MIDLNAKEQNRSIRVFISSTFRDMQEEQTEILLLQYGMNLNDVQ